MISENYKAKIKNSITAHFNSMGITDEEQINAMIPEAITAITDEIKKIQEILNGDDLSELGFHTHTLKGVLLNMGLKEDADKFKEIKHLFEEGKTQEEVKQITKERISIFFED